MADELVAVIEAADVEQATLVGFSMGGDEVARYMRRYTGSRRKTFECPATRQEGSGRGGHPCLAWRGDSTEWREHAPSQASRPLGCKLATDVTIFPGCTHGRRGVAVSLLRVDGPDFRVRRDLRRVGPTVDFRLCDYSCKFPSELAREGWDICFFSHTICTDTHRAAGNV